MAGKKKKQVKEVAEGLSRLETVLDKYNKLSGDHGEITLLNDGAEIKSIPVIPSGVISLDHILGVGGYPQGRIIEVFGPESCLSHDTFIPFEVWVGDKRINHKGGDFRRLYERFHDVDDGGAKQGRHLQNNNADFYIKSVNDEGFVFRNKILDVVKTGKKVCYEVTFDSGQVLRSTEEHKYMTLEGFKPLKDLIIGEQVYVHSNVRFSGRSCYSSRPEVLVKYHPLLPKKRVKCSKTGKSYLYFRGKKSRIAYESYLNNMSYDEYVLFLNTASAAEIDKLVFIDKNLHVHHKDENFLNNEISNLELIDPRKHGELHSKDRLGNLSFVVVPSAIVSIKEVGIHETYDLKCAYPYNNYIANGIVVHNSGKTTVTLHAIASCQKHGGIAAFVDAEHALDVKYAANLGVDTNKLLFTQPDSGEKALNSVEQLANLLSHGDLIVVDSVAALVPQAELNGEVGDSHMGLQARLMSQAMRKLNGVASDSGVTIIFINQIRMKIGVMFGNPETTTGGNALKFYATQRIDVRRGTLVKKGDEVIGCGVKLKVVKNKVAPPLKEAVPEMRYGQGIVRSLEILNYAVNFGLIDKRGAYYYYQDTNIGQGAGNALKALDQSPELLEYLEAEITKNLFPTR